MMIDILLAAWLGILCAISPCPLVSNIAAVGFLSREQGRQRHSILSSVFYILGRMTTYFAIATLLTLGLTAAPRLSFALQKYMPMVMGPLILMMSAVLLDLIEVDMPRWMQISSHRWTAFHRPSNVGAFLLGIVLALNFCPVSAALYFGSLLPMMTKSTAPWALALTFGLTTGLPVLAAVLVLTLCCEKIGIVFHCLETMQKWILKTTGILFLCWGLWMTLKYALQLF